MLDAPPARVDPRGGAECDTSWNANLPHLHSRHAACRKDWGEQGFGRIAMMDDDTYGACYMYYVRAPAAAHSSKALVLALCPVG